MLNFFYFWTKHLSHDVTPRDGWEQTWCLMINLTLMWAQGDPGRLGFPTGMCAPVQGKHCAVTAQRRLQLREDADTMGGLFARCIQARPSGSLLHQRSSRRIRFSPGPCFNECPSKSDSSAVFNSDQFKQRESQRLQLHSAGRYITYIL